MLADRVCDNRIILVAAYRFGKLTPSLVRLATSTQGLHLLPQSKPLSLSGTYCGTIEFVPHGRYLCRWIIVCMCMLLF